MCRRSTAPSRRGRRPRPRARHPPRRRSSRTVPSVTAVSWSDSACPRVEPGQLLAPQAFFALFQLELASTPRMLPTAIPTTPPPPRTRPSVFRPPPLPLPPPEKDEGVQRRAPRSLGWRGAAAGGVDGDRRGGSKPARQVSRSRRTRRGAPRTIFASLCAFSASFTMNVFVTAGLPGASNVNACSPGSDSRAPSHRGSAARTAPSTVTRTPADVVARAVLRVEHDGWLRALELIEPLRAIVADQRGARGRGARAKLLAGRRELAAATKVLRFAVGVDALLLRHVSEDGPRRESHRPQHRVGKKRSAWRARETGVLRPTEMPLCQSLAPPPGPSATTGLCGLPATLAARVKGRGWKHGVREVAEIRYESGK